MIVVLLPAPLGPRNPNISPLLTEKDIPSTALMSGSKILKRSFTSIISSREISLHHLTEFFLLEHILIDD